jgi:hypothetical protein
LRRFGGGNKPFPLKHLALKIPRGEAAKIEIPLREQGVGPLEFPRGILIGIFALRHKANCLRGCAAGVFSESKWKAGGAISLNATLRRPQMKLLDLKIRLLDVRPPIWRRVLLSPELTLAKLHRVIQVAMGWEDAHAYRFHAGGLFYSDPRLELEDGSLDARKIRVGEVFRAKGDRISYEYDFGDDWRHEVLCEEILESDERAPYASCIGGSRACPPEDCGGPPEYAELLQTLKSKSHPGHNEAVGWVGPRFDAETFSVELANSQLSKLFRKKLTR